MAVKRYTVDTNILFYAIDSRDPAKHARALELMERGDAQRLHIVLQSLGELCNSVAKRQPSLRPQAEHMVKLLSDIYQIVPPELEDLTNALAAQRRHKLQFWDTMLCSTAQRARCSTLLSEDMQDGQTLGEVTIRNPFKMSAEEYETYLA